MLFSLTLWVDFIAMAVSLWFALYLLGRGFPSQLTVRAVIVIFSLALFLFIAFLNILHPVPGLLFLKVVVMMLASTTWYSLTIYLLPASRKKQLRSVSAVLFIGALIVTAVMLWKGAPSVSEAGDPLFVAHVGLDSPFTLYGFFQIIAGGGILFNLFISARTGINSQGKYFFIATLFPVFAVIYGVSAFIFPIPLPRLIQDALIFAGVILVGYSVARHQTLVERRTTLHDFPISGLALLGLAGIFALLALVLDYDLEIVALVMVLAIITHSIYDLIREFLERQRYRHESSFRKQLRQLENLERAPEALTRSLQTGIELLCQILDASSGWIAIHRGDNFIVTASHHSIAIGSSLPSRPFLCDDLFQPADPLLSNMAWIAPSFAGDDQVALVAVSSPKSRDHYTADDLDLLAEAADQVGIMVSLDNLRPEKKEQISQLVSEARADAKDLRSSAEALIATLASNPDPELTVMVEDALRHLSDAITLGQSRLASWAGVPGANHVERGRNLQQLLTETIEALHPAGPRPPEPLPHEWYNYVVLHDAYVEGVINREIMARLYISEGTFNRIRRNALRGLVRLLLEKK